MNIKRTVAGLLGAALALSLAACGSDDEGGSSDGYTIGVANFMLSGPYFVGMDEAVKAEAAELGNVEVISTDAGGDAAKLTSNVDDLITQDVDGVIISGGPLGSAPAALNALAAADIPVVLVDRMFQTGEYTSWIGPDNEAIGVQDGEFINEQLGGQGKVAVIKGGPADNSIGLARTEGVLSVLSGVAGIEVVEAPDFGGWSSDGGLQVMESLLTQHADIAAVFCENDAMCLGAQKAASDAGRSEEMFFAGVDGQAEALQAILDGTNYLVTGLNDADIIGRMGLQRIVDILDGADVEKDTVVDSPMVTVENAADYYDPEGNF